MLWPSSILRQDSNTRPSEHESPPITTRPGLPLGILQTFLKPFQVSHISHTAAIMRSQQNSPHYEVTQDVTQNGNFARSAGYEVTETMNGNGKHAGSDVTGSCPGNGNYAIESQTGNGSRSGNGVADNQTGNGNDVLDSQAGNESRNGNDVVGSSSCSSGLSPQSLAMLSSTSSDAKRTSRKSVNKSDFPIAIEMSETTLRQETKAVIHMWNTFDDILK